MNTDEKLPPYLVWEPDGHLSDVALTMIAGPVLAIEVLLPTNRPAPMIPPIEIIVMWRGRRDRLSSGIAAVGAVR